MTNDTNNTIGQELAILEQILSPESYDKLTTMLPMGEPLDVSISRLYDIWEYDQRVNC